LSDDVGSASFALISKRACRWPSLLRGATPGRRTTAQPARTGMIEDADDYTRRIRTAKHSDSRLRDSHSTARVRPTNGPLNAYAFVPLPWHTARLRRARQVSDDPSRDDQLQDVDKGIRRGEEQDERNVPESTAAQLSTTTMPAKLAPNERKPCSLPTLPVPMRSLISSVQCIPQGYVATYLQWQSSSASLRVPGGSFAAPAMHCP
jgi:hypothetical protein